MKTDKLKHYQLYKNITNAGFYLSLIGLLLLIALLFVPFQKIVPTIVIPFENGSVGYSSFPFKENGLSIKLKNVRSDKFAEISEHGEDVIISSPNGRSYHAYYSPFANLLKINVGERVAERVKIFTILMNIPVYILAVLVFYLIRRILYSLKKGTPFTHQNVRLISMITLILILVPIFRVCLGTFTEQYIMSLFNVSFNKSFVLDGGDILCVFGALIFAVLSYVIKQGVEIKEEQDLTI